MPASSSIDAAQIFSDHPRVAEDVGGCAVGKLLACEQHHHAVGKLADHLHRVLDDEDRAARLELGQKPDHRPHFRRGEAADRLVEHQELGLLHEAHQQFQPPLDRKSTRLNSSHANISYAVFCLKKKKNDKLKL